MTACLKPFTHANNLRKCMHNYSMCLIKIATINVRKKHSYIDVVSLTPALAVISSSCTMSSDIVLTTPDVSDSHPCMRTLY